MKKILNWKGLWRSPHSIGGNSGLYEKLNGIDANTFYSWNLPLPKKFSGCLEFVGGFTDSYFFKKVIIESLTKKDQKEFIQFIKGIEKAKTEMLDMGPPSVIIMNEPDLPLTPMKPKAPLKIVNRNVVVYSWYQSSKELEAIEKAGYKHNEFFSEDAFVIAKKIYDLGVNVAVIKKSEDSEMVIVTDKMFGQR